MLFQEHFNLENCFVQTISSEETKLYVGVNLKNDIVLNKDMLIGSLNDRLIMLLQLLFLSLHKSFTFLTTLFGLPLSTHFSFLH